MTPNYLGLIFEGSAGAVIAAVGGWIIKRRQDPKTSVGKRRVRDAWQQQVARLQEINEQRIAEIRAQYQDEIARLAKQFGEEIAFLKQQIRRLQGDDDD